MTTIEDQIRTIVDEAFAQTDPIPMPSFEANTIVEFDVGPVIVEHRRRTRPRTRLLAAAASVLFVALVGGLLVSLSGSDPAPIDEPTELPEPTTIDDDGPTDSIADAFRRLPAAVAELGEYRIAGADLGALEELAAIERPTDLDGRSGAWLDLVSGRTDLAPVPRSPLFSEGLADPVGFADELLFSPIDVGRFVTVEEVAGIRSFDEFTLVSGTDALERAVDVDGYLQIGSGELGERNLGDRTPLRPLGEPIQLGFDAATDTVAIGRDNDFVPAWLDATDDSLWTAAPDLAAIAERLDAIDGLVAFSIRVDDFSVLPGYTDTAGLPLEVIVDETAVIDRAFSAIAQGWSGAGASTRDVFVYVFADERTAAEAAPSVEATFAADNPLWRVRGSTRFTMGSVLGLESVDVVGRTVVVTASRPDPADGPGSGDASALPIFHHE